LISDATYETGMSDCLQL